MLSSFSWANCSVLWHLPTTLPHKWTDDDRLPVFTFVAGERLYGFYCLSLSYWVTALATMGIVSLMALPTAGILYYTFVESPSETSSTGLLLTWSFLLPFWLLFPRVLMDFMLIDNLIIRFAACVVTPTISIFRVLEATYGFAPQVATLSEYMMYFCVPVNMKRDPKSGFMLRATKYDLIAPLTGFGVNLAALGAYQSLFLLVDSLPTYAQGPGAKPANFYTLSSLYNLDIIKDSLTVAFLFQLYLSTFANGLLLLTILCTGYKVHPFSDRPLLCSTSPSDFWGRRWNLIIHQCLKNGVYKPIRAAGGASALAVVAVFGASGLFHEWLLPNVLPPTYPIRYGYTLAFFLWQAILVIMEVGVMEKHNMSWSNRIPRWIKTACVILMGIPPAHWFCDAYWRADFFTHGQFALPMVKPIGTQ